jgi:hypothetical protein
VEQLHGRGVPQNMRGEVLVVQRRAAVAALPPVALSTGTVLTTRLGRDCYVSFGGNAYSVPSPKKRTPRT